MQTAEQKWQHFWEGVSLLVIDSFRHSLTHLNSFSLPLSLSNTQHSIHIHPASITQTHTRQSVSESINSPPKGVGNWAMVQSVSCRPATNSCKTTQRTNLELSFLHSFTHSTSEKQHKWLVHHPETQDHSHQGQRGRDIWVNRFWPAENFLWEEGQNRVPANKLPLSHLNTHTHTQNWLE